MKSTAVADAGLDPHTFLAWLEMVAPGYEPMHHHGTSFAGMALTLEELAKHLNRPEDDLLVEACAHGRNPIELAEAWRDSAPLTETERYLLFAWLRRKMADWLSDARGREVDQVLKRGHILTRLGEELGWEDGEGIVERVEMCAAAGWPDGTAPIS